MPQTATLIIQDSLGVVVSSTVLNVGTNSIGSIPNSGLNSNGGTTSILYEDDDTGTVCDETYTGIILPDPPVAVPEGNVVLTAIDADTAGVNADFTGSTQDGTSPIAGGDSLDITFEYLVDGVPVSTSSITGNFGDPVSGADIATVAAATGINITGGNYESLNYTHPPIAVPNLPQQVQDNFDGAQIGKQGDYGVRVTVDVTSGGNTSTNSDNDLSTFWYLTFENGAREGEILEDEIYINAAGSSPYSPAGFNTTVDNAAGPFALSPEITTLEGESQWNPNSGTQSRADNDTVSASIDGNVDTPFTPTIHTGNYIGNFSQLADTLTDLALASADNLGSESPAIVGTGGTDATIFGNDTDSEYLHWNWQNGVQAAEDSWDNIIQYGPTQADVRQWRVQFSFGGTDYTTDEYRMSLEVFRFFF